MSDGWNLFVSLEWIAQESMSDIENKGGSWSLKLCLDYSRRRWCQPPEPRGTNPLSRAGPLRGCGQIRIRITQQRRIWKCNSLTPLLWSLIRSSKSDAAPQLAGPRRVPTLQSPRSHVFCFSARQHCPAEMEIWAIAGSWSPDTDTLFV